MSYYYGLDSTGYLNDTFDSTNFFSAYCAWPVSGQYCLLNRVLFYVLLVFAVLMRRSPWLVAGALASALSYSGTAAIHAMGLGWYKATMVQGEQDAVVLWAILSSACVIAVPLLNWSSTIRNELHARPIILWWYLLASVGFFCALVGLWYGWPTPITPEFNWGMCNPGRSVNVTELLDGDYSWVFVDQPFIQKYNCSDPCNSEHVQHRTQFRGRDSLLLLNQNQTWGKTHNQQFETFVGGAFKTSFIALPIVVIQGLLTFLFGEKTQHEVRNTVFRFFAGQRKSWRLARPVRLQLWRKYAAQGMALLSYTLAVVAFVLCPLLYIFNIVAIELTLTDYHDSEDPWMVGQWSPVVGALLVLVAATLTKYWERGTSLIRHWLFGSKANYFRRRDHTGALTRPSARAEEPDIARNDQGLPLISAHESGNPGHPTPTHRETFIRRIIVEWELFLAFLADPVAESMKEMRKRHASVTDGSAVHHIEGEHEKHLSPMPVLTEPSDAVLPSFSSNLKSSSFHTLPHEDPDHWQEMTMLDIENVAAHPRHARVHTRDDMGWE